VQSLWDLKRRYKVDSDRVFLFGCGQGGLMAYDVGLSHPDLFAGVIPMSAGPEFFSRAYFRNGQALPFYVINGDRHRDSNLNTRADWRNTVQPAMLFARIDPQTNDILLKTSGLRHATVWLGRNAQGQNMVDFTKPITVRILAKQLARKTLTPCLETLLE